MRTVTLQGQIDCPFNRPGNNRAGKAKRIKRKHHKAIRRADRLAIWAEDYITALPYNRYNGWVS